MFSRPIAIKRGSKGEPEKPFWISYADLMTALMVLFLVAMSVAMLAVTNSVRDIENQNNEVKKQNQQIKDQNQALQEKTLEAEQRSAQLQETMNQLEAAKKELEKYQKTPAEIELERRKAERESEIAQLLEEVDAEAKRHPGVQVHKDQRTIDFGDRARFEKAKWDLRPDQAKVLRAFVPDVLAIARDKLGKKWLKQVVVEGFASPEGTYLYNLNLSMKRSQRVLCVLLDKPFSDEIRMSSDDLQRVRELFLVGGYSFNATKYNESTKSYEESRRVEMRLEFLAIDEPRPQAGAAAGEDVEKCELDR